jgi:cytochrome c oxidase subunit 2
MPIAVAVIVLVIGSVLFHFLSPWWFTPIASHWETIDWTVDITFWVTGFVFVAVNLFMAYVIIRYRYNKNRRAEYQPENKKLELWLTVVTGLGVAAMLAPGLFVWAEFVTPPEDALVFEAVGQQWHWSFRFPGEDGVLGTVDARLISNKNPFGMNPDDPNGQDDILVANPEVHLPLDVPVKALLRSKDVLHDFAVPQFRVKMDLVPGLVTYQWFTPIRAGRYEILCEELCGVAHHTMRGHVVVEEQSAFEDWLAAQPTYAEMVARPPADAEAGAPLYAVCAACHGAQGEGNPVLNAPKLAGQGAWYMKRQLQYYKQGIRGSHEKDVFGQSMAPMAATLADDRAIDNVVAYIGTLPDVPAAATVSGDVARGERIYSTCAYCHGADGSGRQALNAPRQAGMSDWYLVTQLKNFKQGIRGAHPQDGYGPQMALMAAILPDDQAIEDVITYINTLKVQNIAASQ